MKPALSFDDFLAITQLYADYASAVDAGQWDLWPEFFTDDGIYRLQKYAKWADESPSEATYRALLQAIVKLQDEITRYSHRLRKFAVATERLYEYVDTERRNLVAEAPAEPAPWDQDDEELLDRMAALYGLPKTRKGRR